MIHLYKKGKGNQGITFILFHGTGGDEHDLIPYASAIDPTANILSIRGNVTERGMNRYFRRIAEGVFDQEDLAFRTKEMVAFLNMASKDYQFELPKAVLIGYSNGANIIASMALSTDLMFHTTILHHPMVPFRNRSLSLLNQKNVWILAGTNDPLVKTDETHELEQIFLKANANVVLAWFSNGHSLSRDEIEWVSEKYSTEILE